MEQNKFYQIKNITEHEYTLVGCDGSVITRPIQDVDRLASAFTIQDAKNGDILVSQHNKPFIYNGNYSSFRIGSYCGIAVDNAFKVSTEKRNWTDNVNIHPATKEQRDFLFQKMKEEGYEWNAELKKVSKITTPADVGFEELGKAWAEEANKQNLANSAKTCKKSQRMISAEAKEALYDKSAPIDIDKMVDDYANNEEFGKPLNSMIRAYRQGLKDAIGKVVSESAWSEEDEEMLDGIILRCEKYGHQEQINWLKSIKQRIKGE